MTRLHFTYFLLTYPCVLFKCSFRLVACSRFVAKSVHEQAKSDWKKCRIHFRSEFTVLQSERDFWTKSDLNFIHFLWTCHVLEEELSGRSVIHSVN